MFLEMDIAIPVEILRDKRLGYSEKILYGVLSTACKHHVYCVPTNRVLSYILGRSERSVGFLLGKLDEHGYIKRDILRDEDTGEVLERRLSLAEKTWIRSVNRCG